MQINRLMKIGLHQPQYMPWPGYPDKIHKSDKFVFLDDAQYKKRGFKVGGSL